MVVQSVDGSGCGCFVVLGDYSFMGRSLGPQCVGEGGGGHNHPTQGFMIFPHGDSRLYW